MCVHVYVHVCCVHVLRWILDAAMYMYIVSLTSQTQEKYCCETLGLLVHLHVYTRDLSCHLLTDVTITHSEVNFHFILNP